jgi:autotransporter-associated beta strand protein
LSVSKINVASDTRLEIQSSVTVSGPSGLEVNQSGGGFVSLGSVSGGKVTVSGGTVALVGANSYTGGTLVKAGILEVGGSGDLVSLGTGSVEVAGGAMILKNDVTVTDLVLNGGQVRVDPDSSSPGLTVTGTIRATAGTLNVDLIKGADTNAQILKTGRGTLVLGGVNMNGVDVETSAVVTGGTVVVTSATALGVSGVQIGGATLKGESEDASQPMVLMNPLTFTGDVGLAGGLGGMELAGTLYLRGTRRFVGVEDVVTVSGGIMDGGSASQLVKGGAGTLVLSAANGFSGGLVVSARVVELGESGDLGVGRS